jgi:ribulose-5-phosphate 4-epimerase/fuculose-1-phosphate aldolase
VYPGSGTAYLLSPAAGHRKDTCGPEDVWELEFEDDWRAGIPLELHMHSEMHRAHPEAGSLIHVHSPALTQLSVLAEPPGWAMTFFGGFWPSPVPLHEQPDLVRTRPQAQAMVAALGSAALVLLRWHGACIVGASLEEAVYRAIYAEQNAAWILAALAHGRPVLPLPAAEGVYRGTVTDWFVRGIWDYEASYVQ